MPQRIGNEKVNYIVLDDASDTTNAVANTRKLISESKVDLVLGSTITPNSLAMIAGFARLFAEKLTLLDDKTLETGGNIAIE